LHPQRTNSQLRESVLSSRRGHRPEREKSKKLEFTSAVLEVIQEDVESLALDSVLLDNNAATANNLSRVALTVDLAETSPGAQDFRIPNFDQVDLVLGAESLDKFDVFCLSASLDENAQVGLALVQGLGALAETASKTVVNESVLQHLLEMERWSNTAYNA